MKKNNNRKKNNINRLCLAGVFTALVYVVTAYLHIPTYNGYVHCGDGLIFIAACILPMPYSMAVGVLALCLRICLPGLPYGRPAR